MFLSWKYSWFSHFPMIRRLIFPFFRSFIDDFPGKELPLASQSPISEVQEASLTRFFERYPEPWKDQWDDCRVAHGSPWYFRKAGRSSRGITGEVQEIPLPHLLGDRSGGPGWNDVIVVTENGDAMGPWMKRWYHPGFIPWTSKGDWRHDDHDGYNVQWLLDGCTGGYIYETWWLKWVTKTSVGMWGMCCPKIMWGMCGSSSRCICWLKKFEADNQIAMFFLLWDSRCLSYFGINDAICCWIHMFPGECVYI